MGDMADWITNNFDMSDYDEYDRCLIGEHGDNPFVWGQRNGDVIQICDMSDAHVNNSVALLKREGQWNPREYAQHSILYKRMKEQRKD